MVARHSVSEPSGRARTPPTRGVHRCADREPRSPSPRPRDRRRERLGEHVEQHRVTSTSASRARTARSTPTTPTFTLEVSREGNLCSGVVDQSSRRPRLAAAAKTLILTDSSRMTLGGSSVDEADHVREPPRGGGRDRRPRRSLDVNSERAGGRRSRAARTRRTSSRLRSSEIVTRTARGSPVRRRRRRRRRDSRSTATRIPRCSGTRGCTCLRCWTTTASQASLRLGYVLSDDFVASSTTRLIHGNELPGSGSRHRPARRDARRTSRGCSTPTLGASGSCHTRVLARDWLRLPRGRRDAVKYTLAPASATGRNETLITNYGVSPVSTARGNSADGDSWTATDLRRELLNQSHDLIFLAGHFSANDALAADYKTNVLSTELPAAPANLQNTIVFSAGCHAGYNIVERPRASRVRRSSSTGRRRSRRRRRRSSRARATSTATPTFSLMASASTWRSRASSADTSCRCRCRWSRRRSCARSRSSWSSHPACPRSTRRLSSRRRSSACRC